MAGNNEIIFTSSSNQATIYFSVASHRTVPAKGFWLLYEGTYITWLLQMTLFGLHAVVFMYKFIFFNTFFT